MILTLMLYNFYRDMRWDFRPEKLTFAFYFYTVAYLIINGFVLFARDRSLLNMEELYLYKIVALGRINLLSENLKMPKRIKRISVVKMRKKWKRYFALAVPFTTTLVTYDIFLILENNRPYRIFSINKEESIVLANKLAAIYSCKVEHKEPKLKEE